MDKAKAHLLDVLRYGFVVPALLGICVYTALVVAWQYLKKPAATQKVSA